MKGVIVNAMKDMVSDNFGKDKWEAILEKVGLDKNTTFSITHDVEEAAVMMTFKSLCEVLNLPPQQAAETFGKYWVTHYVPKLYKSYYRGITNAKDLILKLNIIHKQVTNMVPNAQPPMFEYKWKDSSTLIMKYISKRGLIAIFVGALKGVGELFHTELKVKQISSEEVEIIFP
ncbi:MAG: heme NO-binding domain-containing protein [Deltaproteobacteria bacterium]|nr:heme NO-binding domain-containing protein [Deltaproteobacteria bacterium]